MEQINGKPYAKVYAIEHKDDPGNFWRAGLDWNATICGALLFYGRQEAESFAKRAGGIVRTVYYERGDN